ncbi:hypothetical protein BD779DRAFT_1579208 [Infundibulicybe gibba]|nr:hypothetical protein BD779DRAFT_1579208 [Infundibulicybe gibba]
MCSAALASWVVSDWYLLGTVGVSQQISTAGQRSSMNLLPSLDSVPSDRYHAQHRWHSSTRPPPRPLLPFLDPHRNAPRQGQDLLCEGRGILKLWRNFHDERRAILSWRYLCTIEGQDD